ncbi:hypothetical protein LXL04_007578 [Taraxacum kok-saghyz]
MKTLEFEKKYFESDDEISIISIVSDLEDIDCSEFVGTHNHEEQVKELDSKNTENSVNLNFDSKFEPNLSVNDCEQKLNTCETQNDYQENIKIKDITYKTLKKEGTHGRTHEKSQTFLAHVFIVFYLLFFINEERRAEEKKENVFKKFVTFEPPAAFCHFPDIQRSVRLNFRIASSRHKGLHFVRLDRSYLLRRLVKHRFYVLLLCSPFWVFFIFLFEKNLFNRWTFPPAMIPRVIKFKEKVPEPPSVSQNKEQTRSKLYHRTISITAAGTDFQFNSPEKIENINQTILPNLPSLKSNRQTRWLRIGRRRKSGLGIRHGDAASDYWNI